eukprot:13048986-Ditylum_brightwellii.AAC.1
MDCVPEAVLWPESNGSHRCTDVVIKQARDNFEKKLKEDDIEEMAIKKDACNTLLFTAGLQSNGGGLSYHDYCGVFQLDFNKIKEL